MDTVSRGMKDTKGAAGVNLDSVFGNDSGNQKKKYETRRADYGQQQYQQPARPAKKLLYLKGTSTRIGGIFLAVTGYIFTAGSIIFFAAPGFGRGCDRF